MKKHVFTLMLPAIIALSLLAAFILVTPVFAQDEVPPEEVPEESPVEEIVEEPATLAESLEETGVDVVDGSGETVSLAEELSIVDPWFKVGTTTYTFTIPDCDPGPDLIPCSNPLQAAVNYISAHGTIPSDGFIHVDAGSIPNQKVFLDGTLPYLNSLKGIVGHVNPDTFTPDAYLTFTDGTSGSYIHIEIKLNGFTLSGLNISGHSGGVGSVGFGVVDIVSSSGSILLQDLVTKDAWDLTAGIRISDHNGLITLKNVDCSRNAGGGAYIENLSGTAGVTVLNSSFSNNLGSPISFSATGIHILTKGAVTITGVNASSNAGTYPDVWVEQASSVTIKSSQFNGNNLSTGLYIQGTNGAISLQSVYLDLNSTGAYLTTNGNITLSNVSASGNAYYGAALDTCGGTPCTNTTGTGKATITNSTFDSNSTSGSVNQGLLVLARGAIVLTNVSASNNGSIGHLAYGALLETSQSQLISPVTVTNGLFNSNYGGGNLEITAKGTITLTSVQADSNLVGPGALLDNHLGTAGITLKGSVLAKNSFGHNGDSTSEHGLEINTNGSVSLNYVMANFNSGSGMQFPSTSAINVTINNGDFNWNGLSGFSLSVLGTISLTNTNASHNASYGALVWNPAASSPKSVTVKNGIFSMNNVTGLDITTKGVVNLNSITANASANADGVHITNTSGIAGITITGGDFEYNHNDGVYIRTNGAIKLTNITAIHNGENGADLNNLSAGTAQPVTISGGDFSHSTSIGLLVLTRGAINFTKVVSDSNGGDGAQLDNSTAVSAQPVTIKSGDFSQNAGMGLSVWTKGALNLASLSVNGNGLAGAYLDQSPANPLFPAATITTGSFNSNGGQGLNLNGRGTIKVTNINASGNSGTGAYLYNQAGNVSVLASGAYGGNCFNSNTGTHDGLDIDTLGMVTLNKVYASGNTGATGVFIYSTATNVTVNDGEFNNQSYGLYVPTKGTISVNNVVASGNTLVGITLMNNSDTTGAKNVIVSRICVKTNGNGLFVHTYGTITVNKIEALNNTGVGVYLDNTYGAFTTPKNISILGSYGTSNIYKNTGTGLLIKTKGNVVISKMTANENVARAIDIDNFLGGLGKGTVSISYVTVNNNGQRGITISSNNNVTLSSITALFNSLGLGFNAINVETNNHNLTISNSLVSGNGYNGIVAYMGPAGVFKITNTYYFGNQGLYNIHLLH